MLAMCLHPEAYCKAQEEIDRIVGLDRLPDFADRGSLPYLECVMKETYRYVIRYTRLRLWSDSRTVGTQLSRLVCGRQEMTYSLSVIDASTAMPHRAMEADVYRGYHIPKGAIVFPNIWCRLFLRDEHPRCN